MSSMKSLRVPAVLIITGFLGVSVAYAQNPSGPAEDSRADNVQTIDYLVPHISTVPANAGKRIHLFLREKIQSRHSVDEKVEARPVVLMIHGRTISTVSVFDLHFENYSWMEFLANAGFDVFGLDLTGYGLSPRPMMDNPCNVSILEQQSYLIPNPLAQPCAPAYPFQLTSIQSDWDEIDTAVDYIRRIRNVDRVNLIGWSLGGPRAGGYAARHPEKVERLFLYAPAYNPLNPSDPPAVLPRPGVPMTVLGNAAFHQDWDAQVKCQNQFMPPIRDVITATMLEFDPLGSTWGSAGVRRSPVWNSPGQGFGTWGWNAEFAGQIKAPTLIIRGDVDTTVPVGSVLALYADLVGTEQRAFVHVACASHYMVWENQHMALLRASEEWLRYGTFAGERNGSFAVHLGGGVQREQ